MKRTILLAAASAVVITAAAASVAKTMYGTWGVDLAAIDHSVRPGNDFFMYVNGTWYKSAVIPPDRASTGSFQDLRILSENRMKEIAASLDSKPREQLTDEERKLRDLYDGFMDERQIEANGLTPAKKDLDYIAGLKTPEDVATAMGAPMLQLDGPFGGGIAFNPKNTNEYQLTLGQSGLGMPDRDYYLKDDAALQKTREAYKKHLATVFTLAGLSNPAKRAEGVYDLEHKIAEVSWPNADRRDVDKVFNPMSVSQLKGFAPQFPWDAYLKSAGVSVNGPKSERVLIIAEKSAFPKLAEIFGDTPIETWRDYLTAHYLHAYAAYLPKALEY
jgi:putative endopeptidase